LILKDRRESEAEPDFERVNEPERDES